MYLTADSEKISGIVSESQKLSKLGAGPLRIHNSLDANYKYNPEESDFSLDHLSGADLILDRKLIENNYPFLSADIAAALHIRRAGWLSAQQLGMYMLQKARDRGVQFLNLGVEGFEIQNNRIIGVRLNDNTQVATNVFINAAGPFLQNVGKMMDLNIPVFCELHKKVTINDHKGAISRDVPLLIWMDKQYLPWSKEERHEIEADPDLRWLLEELPAGIHTRPEGGMLSEIILMLWEYETKIMEPKFPIPQDGLYPDLLIRGLQKMVPRLEVYTEQIPKPVVDGGYYTKTIENRPIIGRTEIEGSYIIGALSGFGIMAACGAGELLALDILDKPLPDLSPKFWMNRYENPEYLKKIEGLENSGQL